MAASVVGMLLMVAASRSAHAQSVSAQNVSAQSGPERQAPDAGGDGCRRRRGDPVAAHGAFRVSTISTRDGAGMVTPHERAAPPDHDAVLRGL